MSESNCAFIEKNSLNADWYWQTDTYDWKMYCNEQNQIIEQDYQNYCKAVELNNWSKIQQCSIGISRKPYCNFIIHGRKYEIEFGDFFNLGPFYQISFNKKNKNYSKRAIVRVKMKRINNLLN